MCQINFKKSKLLLGGNSMRFVVIFIFIISIIQNVFAQEKSEIKEASLKEYRSKIAPFYNYEEFEKHQPQKIVEITDEYLEKNKESLCDFYKIQILRCAGGILMNSRFKEKIDRKKVLNIWSKQY